jgi:hypothetical protein
VWNGVELGLSNISDAAENGVVDEESKSNGHINICLLDGTTYGDDSRPD